MEKVRIGINGFGRIGRLTMRIAEDRDDVEVVAINDPQLDADYMAYLLEYDSVHGRFHKPCRAENGNLTVGDRKSPGRKRARNISWSPRVFSPPWKRRKPI